MNCIVIAGEKKDRGKKKFIAFKWHQVKRTSREFTHPNISLENESIVSFMSTAARMHWHYSDNEESINGKL